MMDHLSISNPKVSVCVVTYNQESYISQCLQSILDQNTDFEFEIVVGDDCSTDATRTIVADFALRYPKVIRPIFHEKNVGPYENYLRVHKQAVGRYVAHIDGDDFALPGKLQAQVDVLDADPDCNVVWHRVDILYPDGSLRKSPVAANKRSLLEFNRLDQINYILIGAHSSKMYRAGVCELTIPAVGFTDFYLNISHIGSGHGVLLSERSLGVHRVGIGISSSGHSTRRILIGNLEALLQSEPASRSAVNSAILHLLLSDIKRRSPTFRATLSLFLRSVSFAGIWTYLSSYSQRKALVL